MILERLRNGVRKLAADAGMGKEYKDVFELEGAFTIANSVERRKPSKPSIRI